MADVTEQMLSLACEDAAVTKPGFYQSRAALLKSFNEVLFSV